MGDAPPNPTGGVLKVPPAATGVPIALDGPPPRPPCNAKPETNHVQVWDEAISRVSALQASVSHSYVSTLPYRTCTRRLASRPGLNSGPL